MLALSACSFEEGVGPDAGSIPDVTVAFGSDGTTIDEDSGTITLPVTLSGVSTHEVRVDFTIGSATTATRPDDFTLSDGSLIFMPGQTEKTIEITIAKDSVEESDETIVVQLGQPIGATLGMKASYTVTISADILPRVSFADPAPSNAAEATSPQVEVKLTTPPKSPVTVELGVAGTASLADRAVSDGQLITFAANQTSVLVPLGVVPDLVDEDDETIELTLKNPSVGLLLATTNLARSHTIADDDLPPTIGFAASTSSTNENQPIGLTVELSAPSGRIITVDYAAAFGTASAADATVTGAPGTLTFMPGETSKAISVAVANDSLDENNETLSVTLANPINATLTTATNTLTINDDDNPPSVAFAQAAASTNETMTAVNVTVQLSAASSFAVTVPFSVGAASTADNPEDYTLASTAALTIPAGMTSATITVNVKADTLDEANETVVLSLGTPTNASAGSITTETLTITDDDAPPSVAFTSTGSSPNEGNSNITLTVQLSDISGQDVTIPFAIDAASTATDPDDYTISPPSPLVIPAGQTSTTITIAMKEDTLDEADETVIVVLGAATNATLG
ncbi:MAG TPA: Calx-beta domain-containing protein, partial [Kofleriaceae bacterium]